ncbi:hypothetical protein U27_00539 [Candidatus Vecturithrix granuli]|uniref:EamA domain-containing protein n=1 Tax=Vecturithrix granuli TaxID=1499967 RepID=A0A081C7T7_VECG1|nr:hypothetical protein U27_00539 [Candidatus Vecturithrix granuli]
MIKTAMLTFLPGILLGLVGSCNFSVAFLGSRIFYEKSGQSPFNLLILSYIQMGIFSIVLLPFVWQNTLLSWQILPPLLGFAFFGMSGQLTFFLALRYAQSSQVTPLLALKILIIAGGSVLILQKNLSFLQWLSVAICFTAALALNFSGVAMPVRALLYVIVTCCAYTCADICVTLLIRRLESLAVAHSALLATCLAYGVSGIVGALLMIKIWQDLRLTRPWKYALYFSTPYFLADICIFATFKLVGPVLANILMSTRGITSILLASIIARKNMAYLEQPTTTAVTIRRLLAAALLTLAIALYVIGEPA